MAPLRFIKEKFQSLATEIYEYLHDISLPILVSFFKVNKTIPYDLKICELYARNLKSIIISFLSQKVWALIRQNIRDSSSL